MTNPTLHGVATGALPARAGEEKTRGCVGFVAQHGLIEEMLADPVCWCPLVAAECGWSCPAWFRLAVGRSRGQAAHGVGDAVKPTRPAAAGLAQRTWPRTAG